MNEQDFLASENQQAMLRYLTEEFVHAAGGHGTWVARQRPLISKRQLQLVLLACRSKYNEIRSLHRMEWENYETIDRNRLCRLIASHDSPIGNQAICHILRDVVGNPFRPICCEMTGNEFGTDTWSKRDGKLIPCECGTCRWYGNPTVQRIAQSIYDDQSFEDMPILGDALEEAGCENEDILRHCRGEELIPGKTIRSIRRCPECEGPGRWRNGVGFEHEKICMAHKPRSVVWEPGADYTLSARTIKLRGPHVKGCFVLDIILGKS